MTEILFVPPPDPPEGKTWCLMCLMNAKGRLIEDHPELAQLAKDGNRARHWVPWNDRLMLQTADYTAICDVPQLGMVGVCWTHLAFLKVQPNSMLLQPGGQLPPGLRGMG